MGSWRRRSGCRARTTGNKGEANCTRLSALNAGTALLRSYGVSTSLQASGVSRWVAASTSSHLAVERHRAPSTPSLGARAWGMCSSPGRRSLATRRLFVMRGSTSGHVRDAPCAPASGLGMCTSPVTTVRARRGAAATPRAPRCDGPASSLPHGLWPRQCTGRRAAPEHELRRLASRSGR